MEDLGFHIVHDEKAFAVRRVYRARVAVVSYSLGAQIQCARTNRCRHYDFQSASGNWTRCFLELLGALFGRLADICGAGKYLIPDPARGTKLR